MNIIPKPIQFVWDTWNIDKNLVKHQVTNQQCEEVFFDSKKKIVKDIFHSGNEDRYIILGATKQNRILFLVFTIRGSKVRVISVRDLNRKERYLYEKTD